MNDQIQIENPMHINKKIQKNTSNNGITILMPVTINFLQNSDEKSDECIICLNPGNLIKNGRCSCIYFYHKECNDKTEYPNRCLLCKKDYAVVNNLDDYCNGFCSSLCCACFILLPFVLLALYIQYAK